MLDDKIIITHHFPERNDLKIYPISDVHLGAVEHLSHEWEDFCRKIEAEENSYLVIGGDLVNNATRSSVSDIFSETLRPSEQKKKMAEYLRPIKDKILCAVPGNHEARSRKDADDDPLFDVLCKLDKEDLYRENMAFVKIQMGDPKANGNINPTYIFAVGHGAGGGMLTGGTVNRAERFGYVIDGVDMIFVGHSHKPFITQPAKLKVDPYNNKVTVKPFKVVSMTSWLDYGGYAMRKMLLPSSYAPQIVTLAGKKKEIKVTM